MNDEKLQKMEDMIARFEKGETLKIKRKSL